MPISLDAYLGVHAQALALQGKRSEVLATNLANSDTPNYKARDVDFRAALAAAATPGTPGAPLALAATDAKHLGAQVSGTAGAELKYRVPLAPSLDGNTVDVQLEQAAFAENSVRYQATLTFLSQRFKGLMTAITGQ
jgi:flagellar basal-body rod protein FlgB